MKIAVFPGSFDPITIGHVDIAKRAAAIFDKVIVAVGINSQKKTIFSLETRLEWIDKVFEDVPNVESGFFEKLTVDYCDRIGAQYLIRGLRSAADFDYEKTISQINQSLGKVETVFLISQPEYSFISSTIVREVLRGGGDASSFLPSEVIISPNSLNLQ